MKKLILSFLVMTIFSAIAGAVPRGVYLASPEKITVKGNTIELLVRLACKNEFPDEWAGQLVIVSDDEGDRAYGVGVILSESSCERGPKKLFSMKYDLLKQGLIPSDLLDTTFKKVPGPVSCSMAARNRAWHLLTLFNSRRIA